jgi:hypothetical protein
MKDELQGESQAEMGGAEKSGKAHISAQLIFLPSFHLASNQKAQSYSVKVGQSDSVGQADGQNPRKSLIMSSLHNNQLQSGQTIVNLVKHGQNKPVKSQRCQKSGCARLQVRSPFVSDERTNP